MNRQNCVAHKGPRTPPRTAPSPAAPRPDVALTTHPASASPCNQFLCLAPPNPASWSLPTDAPALSACPRPDPHSPPPGLVEKSPPLPTPPSLRGRCTPGCAAVEPSICLSCPSNMSLSHPWVLKGSSSPQCFLLGAVLPPASPGMFGNVWAVTSGVREILLVSRGQRPEMLLNIPSAQDCLPPAESFPTCGTKGVEVTKSQSKGQKHKPSRT